MRQKIANFGFMMRFVLKKCFFQNIVAVALLVLFGSFGVSCSNTDDALSGQYRTEIYDASEFFERDSVEGMVRVNASGAYVILGTDDLGARMVERPQMKVTFTYGFSMGRHEVLCKDFNALMKLETGLAAECVNDSMPVYDVTYLDAVLYANAVSKSKGMDTSYVYSSAEFDAEKHCVKLNGFVFKPESNGFRLPTEAEWMLVASQSWHPRNAWNGENSGYKVHEVCTAEDRDERFCDMAGNLLEWVNDWQGFYTDTTLMNYVGAMDGGALGSCVVKGGSIHMKPSTIKYYNRGDTYPVLYSSRADYVGFRLAYGSIPDATWLSQKGAAVSTPVVPLVNFGELSSWTQSYKVKLAFRNDETRNLVYVNYASDVPTVVEIPDTMEVFHPEISPDGRRVAFCTGLEGQTGNSSLYVRDLNATGSNLVKLDVENAAIPRWYVGENGDTSIVYVSSAKNNKDESFFGESTWQVEFANGRFGTPRKLFDGAYHGGVNARSHFAVTGSTLLRAHLENPEKQDLVWYGGEQACNVSLAKDGSYRVSFLDFGAKEGEAFLGQSYGVHEQLLIADSTGKLVQMVASPKGFAFDHSEWAGGILHDSLNDFIVATLSNANGSHQKIALVNLADGSVTPLVEGGELWHPSLWIYQGNSLVAAPSVNLDSAGVYFRNDASNVYTNSSVELGIKLQSFWKKSDSVECVVLGSSMLMDAVIEDSVKSFKTLNMGVTLSDIHLFEYLVEKYISLYVPNIKVLVVELAPGFMYRTKEDMFYVLYTYSPGLQYDMFHLSAETKDEIAQNSMDQEYPLDLFSQQYMEGTFLLPSVGWSVPSVFGELDSSPYESEAVLWSLEAFKSIKQMADQLNVKVVAAITPQNPDYKSTNAFSYYGPSHEVARRIINDVSNMGILVFDENKYGEHDYTDEMAFNANHVSYLGAAQFTARLDSLLETFK